MRCGGIALDVRWTPRGRRSGLSDGWSTGLLTGLFLAFLVTLALCVVIYQVEGGSSGKGAEEDEVTVKKTSAWPNKKRE